MAKREIPVHVDQVALQQFRGDMLVLGLFKDTKKLPAAFASLDRAIGGAIGNLLKLGDFTGKQYETTVLYISDKVPCPRILVVGLGEAEKIELNVLRQAAGTATRAANRLSTSRLGFALHAVIENQFSPDAMAQAIIEGAIVANFTYQEYLPKKNDKKLLLAIVEPRSSVAVAMKPGAKVGAIVGRAQNRARLLANKPGNEINPPVLARYAQQLARQFGLRCKIFDDRQLAKMKMNAILAVGNGSASKPRLIVLEYRGKKNDRPDVVVVGKGITFDSGGISIKPYENMDRMKFDKSGACAVLGIITAVAELKLPINLVGLIPTAENLLSDTAFRPGDIITTYSGKTVEIMSTDAEGRMILSDALAYGVQMKPKAVIDLATLTGGCVVALGENCAGLFGNNADLLARLERSAESAGERVWQMPYHPDYLEQTQSKIADLKNSAGREGSSCTGAAFLGEFVDNVPWAHIDIAGTARAIDEKPWRAPGATGFGVRTVVDYLRSFQKAV